MGGQWRKENPNPRVHRSGGKLGEPRFPLERVDPRVGIFLSPLTTHDGFYLSYLILSYLILSYLILSYLIYSGMERQCCLMVRNTYILYIYTRVFLAHVNGTLVFLGVFTFN